MRKVIRVKVNVEETTEVDDEKVADVSNILRDQVLPPHPRDMSCTWTMKCIRKKERKKERKEKCNSSFSDKATLFYLKHVLVV